MHEVEAVRLIKPVFDFFLASVFERPYADDEYEYSLGCFGDFVKDSEPYWVGVKAQWIIARLLTFKDEIGDVPESLKETVLAVVRSVRAGLGKEVSDEVNASDSIKIRVDFNMPEFIQLHHWARLDWNRNKQPLTARIPSGPDED